MRIINASRPIIVVAALSPVLAFAPGIVRVAPL
jgi:hypothetical protein